MTDLRHQLALLLAAESERALTAEERLEQMTRERDEARQILKETIDECDTLFAEYKCQLAQTKEELIMLQEHEQSRNRGRTLDQLSDDLSWEDAYRRGLLEGSKAVELEHEEALLELERWRNGTTIKEDFARPRDFEADKLLRKLLFGAPTRKNADENP